MEKLLERRFKIPLGARNTAKKIEAKRIVLGKGMAGDVRFREQAEAGDAAGSWKLMPLRFADGAQLHPANHAVEKCFHRAEVAQRIRGATEGLDDPFDAAHARVTTTPEAFRIPDRICWRAG